MRAYAIAIAAMLVSGSAALADPPEGAPPQPSPRPQQREVVLAAAEAQHTPAQESAQLSNAQAKRRIARVTTCRCGDPQPSAENQEQ
jgi:hypothetical protein